MSADREPQRDQTTEEVIRRWKCLVQEKKWKAEPDARVRDSHADMVSAPVVYGAHRLANDYDRTKPWDEVLQDSDEREDVRKKATLGSVGYFVDTLHAEQISIIMIDTPAGAMYFDNGGAKIVFAGLVDAKRVDRMLERREQLIESRTQGIIYGHERVNERANEAISLRAECQARANEVKNLLAQIEQLKKERRAGRRALTKLAKLVPKKRQ